jgi:hypothetical protein
MQTTARPPTDAELRQARAILDLHAKDWERAEILMVLGISEATYWRRLRLKHRVKKGKVG